MAEVRDDRFRVDPGSDEEAREGVAALVQADRIEADSSPCRESAFTAPPSVQRAVSRASIGAFAHR
jgi:hypothetical protein